MARSLLQGFVTGTRALLAAQLIVCVGAVALAGWTLGVTSEVMRERNRLQERVIQLEETMAARGDIPPPPAAVVAPVANAQSDIAYPGSIADAVEVSNTAQQASARVAASDTSQRSISNVITSLFGPAPPLRTVVLHVRTTSDVQTAQAVAADLQQSGAHLLINIMPEGDQRPAGYAYFDGRQSRTAADIVGLFHETARRLEIAQWSAQLRGTALPAQGEFTADRLDIILPPLPPQPTPDPSLVAAPPMQQR
jgi:hypothetical protein